MARIEGFRIKNFRALKDVALGIGSDSSTEPLTPMTAVIGKNGVGKSSLLDAFGFLSDCLASGVEEACDKRGGFHRILSQGQTEPIEFEIYYKESEDAPSIGYIISIEADDQGRAYVHGELLFQDNADPAILIPSVFLVLDEGRGFAWKGEAAGQQMDEAPEGFDFVRFVKKPKGELSDAERIELDDPRKLGIATLGALKQHPRIAAFRRFIEGWYLSYFTPNAARSLPLAGPQKHLNIHGDNLGNVVQFMEREHPDQFKKILKKIAKRIPGMDKIDTEKTKDGRLLLRFNDKGFQDPLYAQQVSDGTLKVFAYLLLLEDPTPPPFLCIEEPENGLYHKLLETLADEFRDHATGRKDGSQIFVTTHQPYFVDALEPNEVWILNKGKDGFSTVSRASDDEVVKSMVEQGLPLGSLWYSDYLDSR